METSLNNGMCRCCASEGTFKNFSNTYHWMGQEEVYADMLKECFDISLTTSEPGEEGGICEVCITQLRNAANFKKQVQHTEEQFKRRLENKLFKSDVVKIEAAPLDEVNNSDNDNNLSDNFSELEFELPIKKETEEPKPKKRAAKPTTSRAKKPKLDDGEPSTKRKRQKLIRIDVKDVNTKEIVATRELSYVDTDKDEDYILIIEKSNDSGDENQTVKTSSTVKENGMVNTDKLKTVVQSNNNRKEDATAKYKHLTNIKAVLEYSNATIIRHRGGIGYVCSFCPEQYPDAADLKRHTLERHNDVNQCYINNISICDNIIKVDITSLRCKLCDSNIKSLEDLMEHLQNTHGVKIFTDIKNQMIPLKFDTKILTCAICDNGAVYNKFKSLLEHMKVHYRNYVCQECDAGFINPAQLRVHMNFHDIGNYACEICGKVFTNGRTLKAHVRAVHIVKSQPAYKCGYCNENFQFFHSKERHLQKVHGVVMAPINCQACDKSFTTRSTYLAHMKLNHLMIRPHACAQCNKSFTYSAALKEHERRVHMGLKLYECDLCNKHFSTKNALRQHIRIHTNDRRYKCQICGQAFVAKSSWRGHMRSKHDEMV